MSETRKLVVILVAASSATLASREPISVLIPLTARPLRRRSDRLPALVIGPGTERVRA